MNIALNFQKIWFKSTSCYLLLIMMTYNTSINAQTQEIDSLQYLLTVEKNDSILIETNRVLSNRYYSINRDSSIMYVKETLRLATAINNTYLVAKSQEELGLAYAGNKNYDLGLEYGLNKLDSELKELFGDISSQLDFGSKSESQDLNIELVKEIIPKFKLLLTKKSPKAKISIKELEEAGLSGDLFDKMKSKLNKYDFKNAFKLINEIEKSLT